MGKFCLFKGSPLVFTDVKTILPGVHQNTSTVSDDVTSGIYNINYTPQNCVLPLFYFPSEESCEECCVWQ